MLACRQHGDHHLRILHGIERRIRDRNAIGLRRIALGRDQIEAKNLVSSLDEICGHRATHVAEADECDIRHDVSSDCYVS
jgi:hypothetical protein